MPVDILQAWRRLAEAKLADAAIATRGGVKKGSRVGLQDFQITQVRIQALRSRHEMLLKRDFHNLYPWLGST
jgi:hypothetical protein